MITCTRRLEIDAGHRLMRHESKCRHLHGHRYAFEITVKAAELDEVGRVIDFGAIKERLGAWLDEWWDHAFIVQDGDSVIAFLEAEDLRHFVMVDPPTAENLAAKLGQVAKSLLPPGIMVVRIRCWETPNCFADWTP